MWLTVLTAALLFVTVSSVAVDFTHGSCQSFPALNTEEGKKLRLINPCVGVVNYPFYVAPGSSLKSMQTAARNALAGTSLTQLKNSCVQNILRLTCANIYLKCYAGVDVSNPATYNTQIYSDIGVTFGVPYYRPCQSICTGTYQKTNPSSACFGTLFPVVGSAPNCSARFDYSLGHVAGTPPSKYDPTNSPTTCFTPPLMPVATLVEQYKHSEDPSEAPCSGYVDKFVVPPAPKLNANLTLLQLPGVVQTMLNKQIAAGFAGLPPFIKPDCYYSFREQICRTTFFAPHSETVKQAMRYTGLPVPPSPPPNVAAVLGMSLTVPLYPPIEVCYDFVDKCGPILPQLKARSSAISGNCSRTISGAHLFPTTNQTISTIVAPAGTLGVSPVTIKIFNGPNPNVYYNTSQLNSVGYTPSCPTGFVIPDDPNNPDVVWIGESACAMSCLAPEWDKDEWDSFHRSQRSVPIVGIVFGLVFISFLLFTQTAKDAMGFFLFAILSLIASFDSLYVGSKSLEDGFCFNNAVETRLHGTGQTHSASSACVVQGGIIIYTYMACCAIMIAITIDWRIKKYPKIQEWIFNNPSYTIGYYISMFFICTVFPFIPLIYAAAEDLIGFSRSSPYCFVRSFPYAPENDDIAIMVIPICICTGIYFLIFFGFDFCGILTQKTRALLFNASFKVEGHIQPTPYEMAIHIATGITIAASFIIFIPFVVAKGVVAHDRDNYLQAMKDWTYCVFGHYREADPNHSFDVCGWHPSNRPSAGLVTGQVIFLSGNNLIIGSAFMISFTIAYLYYTHLGNYSPVNQSADGVSAPASVKNIEDDNDHGVSIPPVALGKPVEDGNEEVGVELVATNNNGELYV